MPTLSDAIVAIKAGRRDEARDMLTQILSLDQRNVTTLLWMTEVSSTDEERRKYLNRILEIDPNNPHARKGLGILSNGQNRIPSWIEKPETNISYEPAATQSFNPEYQIVVKENRLEITHPTRSLQAASSTSEMTIKPRYIALLGGIAIIAGSMMPWGIVSSIYSDINTYYSMGTDRVDGTITLVIGVFVVLASLLASETRQKRVSPLASVFSLICGIIGIMDLSYFSQLVGYEAGISSTLGAGLYVLTIGAIFGMVGGFVRNPRIPAERA